MILYEHEGKAVFRENGIAVPGGRVVGTAEEAREATARIGRPVVIKPQVSTKKRGKAGAIRFASGPEEAFREARELLGMTLGQEKVSALLVEERIDIAKEFYVGMTVDYSLVKPVAIASPLGGVDIEEAAREHPAKVKKVRFSMGGGLSESDLDELASAFEPADRKPVRESLVKVHGIFRKYDAQILEINPLVLTKRGDMVALDAFLNVDDDSLFRHPELVRPRGKTAEEYEFDRHLKEMKWKFIEMDPEGEIGILSSGAGVTMAILDLIHAGGGRPANFLDTSQMDAEGIYKAFSLFAGNKKLKVLLVNIFAGLNRCDDLAMGIRRYLEERSLGMPLVVRMIGHREDEGKAVLREIGVETIRSLEESVDKALRIAKRAK